MICSTKNPTEALIDWCEHERQWMLNEVSAMESGECRIIANGSDETTIHMRQLEGRVSELNGLLADISAAKDLAPIQDSHWQGEVA